VSSRHAGSADLQGCSSPHVPTTGTPDATCARRSRSTDRLASQGSSLDRRVLPLDRHDADDTRLLPAVEPDGLARLDKNGIFGLTRVGAVSPVESPRVA